MTGQGRAGSVVGAGRCEALRFVDKPRALFTIAPMNQNASALGKLAKGKPKTLTEAQRKASADRMRLAQKLRWKNKARQDQPQ